MAAPEHAKGVCWGNWLAALCSAGTGRGGRCGGCLTLDRVQANPAMPPPL